MTEKDKEAPYGRYASGRPRPKPPKRKVQSFWYKLIQKWWLKAIERWRKGEVLVEKPRSLRKQLRQHRVGVEGHAKSSLAQQKKVPASLHTHRMVIEPSGDRWRVPLG